MVSSTVETARNVVGIIGNVISLLLFLAPVPTFIEIFKRKSVEQYSPIPYLATLVNCLVWVLYGLPMVHPNSILVITINGAGTAIELIYIILFFIYANKKQRVKVIAVILLEFIAIAILALLVLTLLHTTKDRSLVVGIICIVFNICMYAAPLSVMKLVITSKSVEYMPFSLSFASLANSVAWTSYAFLPFDPFICIPNGIGTVFSLAQMLLYATYYKSTKRIMAERKAKEINLAEVVVPGDMKTLNGASRNGA